MYIFSFFKSLLTPRNFLSTLYFLANMAIIFGVFYFLNLPIVDVEQNRIYSGLVGLGINFLFIFISLSPVGEWSWRIRNGIKSAPPSSLSSQWEVANRAFEEVRDAARQKSRSVSKHVKLYFHNTNDINAFALGHRTVAVTAGLLAHGNLDVFRGVLAHELGHIAHGDSDLNLGINVCNGFINLFVTFVYIFGGLIIALVCRDRDGILLAILFRVFFNIIVVGIFRLWTLLGVICINTTSKKVEFAADAFAKELGYGSQLKSFLYALDGSTERTKWYDAMFRSHPDTADRVEALAA